MTAIAPERPPWEEGSVWPVDWDPSKHPKIGTPFSDSFMHDGFSLDDILKQSTEMKERFEKTIIEVESIMLPVRGIVASGDPSDDEDDDNDNDVNEYEETPPQDVVEETDDDSDEDLPEPVAGATYDDDTGWTEPIPLSDASQTAIHEHDRAVIASMARTHLENEDTQPITRSSTGTWSETAETEIVPWVPDETRVQEAVSALEMTRTQVARVWIRSRTLSLLRRLRTWSVRSLNAFKDYMSVLNGNQSWTRSEDADEVKRDEISS